MYSTSVTHEDNSPQAPNFFVIIPSHILDDARIDDATAVLFGRIASLSNNRGYCWASDKYLAELTRTKERELRYRLKTLEDCGYIHKETEKHGMIWSRKIYPNFNYERHKTDIKNNSTKGTPVPFERHTCAVEQDKSKHNKQLASKPSATADLKETTNKPKPAKNEPAAASVLAAAKEKKRGRPPKVSHIEPAANAALLAAGFSAADIEGLASHGFDANDLIAAAEHSRKSGKPKGVGWIVRCIQKRWFDQPTKESHEETNREAIRERFGKLDGRRLGAYEISVCKTYIEFSWTTGAHVFHYSDMACFANVQDFLAKKGLQMPN